MRQNVADVIVQFFLIACLFFALTGGAFIISWEQLKYFRDLHYVLSIVFIILGGFVAWRRYLKDQVTFFQLEPVRLIKHFFELPAVISVGTLSVFYFVTQLTYQIAMHAGFETALWDLGFYDQVIWNTGHGNFLMTSVRGGLHVFCEHFKPILALLAPVYWVGNNTVLLLTIFTLIASSSIALSYLIAEKLTRSHHTALIFTFCVFFYPPLRNTINFLLHTQALADPFILLGFYFVLKNQLKSAVLFFGIALMCKENIALDVLGVGLFLISRKQKGGWFITSLALLFFVSYVFIIEPYFRYPYHFVKKWNSYAHLIHFSPDLWKELLSPNPLLFLILLFGPFVFLSFKCKGWWWLLGPSLAVRLLSSFAGLRLTTAHYTGGLNALVIISAIYGLASIKSASKILVFLIFSALLFAGKPQLFKIDKYLWEASKPDYQRIIRILESVPIQYSVLTNERPSAHLSHRSNLYVFLSMFPHAPLEEVAKRPDLIIEDTEKIQMSEQKLLAEFIQSGYRLVFEFSFLKIYANPLKLNSIPNGLIDRWETLKQFPVIPYRKMIQLWYRSILMVAFLFLCVSIFRTRYRWRLQPK